MSRMTLDQLDLEDYKSGLSIGVFTRKSGPLKYHPQLAGSSDGKEYDLFNLYKVSYNGADFFVMAESKEGAISQASCAAPKEEQTLFSAEASATRLPFLMRGFGGYQF